MTHRIKNYIMRMREKSGASFLHPFGMFLKKALIYPSSLVIRRTVHIMLGLTYRCQCNCVHCGIKDQYNHGIYRKELDTIEIKRLIGQIARLPYLFIKLTFFGGEPLLHKDIFELISYASKRGLFTDMDTNGFLLSRANVEKLKKGGLHHIYVSLDSMEPERHDRLRGLTGCHRNAIEGIKNCIRLRLPCSVSTCASRESLSRGDLRLIANNAKLLGITSVRFLYPVPAGKWCGNKTEILSDMEKQELGRLLEPGFVYLESPDQYNINFKKQCAAVLKKFLYVSPYGDIQLCPFVPESFGNIRLEDFEEIIRRIWQDCILLADHKGCLAVSSVFQNRSLKNAYM